MSKTNDRMPVHSSPTSVYGPIPYGKQNITESDIQAVVETLRSDYLTQGPKIAEFEEAFATYIGTKYAVAVSNGTAALHLSAMALGVQTGDKVITTPITFAASANCVRYCGGEVVFADIDPETYLLDINKVSELLKASPMGTYKGIIPVDFAGRAVNLEAFKELAKEYDLWILEDSCHAPGGYLIDSNGVKQNCGNGNFADLAIFSLHPVKHIAAGEGGMITTNNVELFKKLLKLRTHGITKDPSEFINPIEFAIGGNKSVDGSTFTNYPNWYMEMQTLGYNYRLTDFQAALGLSQLKRADNGLQKRHEIAVRYYAAFKDIPQITDRNLESANNHQPIVNSHAHHLYVVEVNNRLELYNHLRVKNIYAQIHYIPAHLLPYYQQLGWKHGDMPLSEEYYSGCISLPMYPTLTESEQAYVIKTIITFYNGK